AVVHDVASEKFLNVSVVTEGTDAWIYGSGRYRASPVYLAKVALADIENRGAWSYLGADGKMTPDEAAAAPVVDSPCVGELSVRRHPTLGVYVMTYNCDTPRG